ncbi:MAG: Gfo/Idh/MocA family protein [Cyclobacteriaceae bacterium]
MEKKTNRREFLTTTGAVVAGSLVAPSLPVFARAPRKKMRVALIGTGIRGISMWGRSVQKDYADQVEFVGLCDSNPSRLAFGKEFIGAKCNTYTDFEQMMREQKPEMLIVTTMDANHHEFIIKGMEMGANVITEKPMTTDENKVQAILDAERSTGKNVTVTFNYRYSPHRQKMYELLREGAIGDVTSVDFHWYLDTDHGASYFRRWHGQRENSGTLLVHKSTHHFDLLNWWLESEPEEVFAFGKLEHYGSNGKLRGPNCRSCEHKSNCDFYWDITKSEHDMKLYVDHEEHDGYIRDNCVFRKEINIYDKMAATIRYANDVQVSYSLTTYSPYEGYRIAFNGTKGRLEAWIQESQPWEAENYDELRLTKNFGKSELIRIPHAGGGHGGGDARLKDKIFKNPDMADPYRQSAGSRDGAMSVLIGVAARRSIESGMPVKIGTLSDLKPLATRL